MKQWRIKNIIIIIISVLIILLAVYNCIYNKDFLIASLANIITIAIAIFVSFYLVQKRTDERKQKDILLDLLEKLKTITETEEIYKFDGQSKEKITMRNRDISNKIGILERVNKSFVKKEDICFIRSKFDEYREFVGDHIEDIQYLSKSEKELKRPIELINNRITDMEIRMFE